MGKTIQLNHKTYTVLGVMPVRFTWGDGEVFVPMKLASDQLHRYSTKIKLKPGVSMAAAEAEFRPLYQEFDRQTPNVFPKQFKISVRGLADTYTRDLKKTMVLLFGAVALLLAIGCGNVSILLLARGAARQHEFAIRSAVGASGFRMVRQLLTESLLLSATGAGLGILVAYRAIGFLIPRLPDHSYPYEADFHINLAVLFFSVGLALLSGIVFGLFPALQSARPEISQVMQAGTQRLTGSVKGKRLHTALIAGQIALTLLLITAAGAAIQAFIRMNAVPLGYEPQHVMSVEIPINEDAHATWADRAHFLTALRDKIAAMPGVLSAGVPPMPLHRTAAGACLSRFSANRLPKTRRPNYRIRWLRVLCNLADPIRQRPCVGPKRDRERRHARPRESGVRACSTCPGGDALSHAVRVPQFATLPPMALTANGAAGWLQIIGVVGDSLDDGLDKPVEPAVYAPYTLITLPFTQVLVRAQGEPLAMLHSIKQQIASIDPDQQTAGDIRDLEG